MKKFAAGILQPAIFCAGLAVMLTLGLCACGGSGKNESTGVKSAGEENWGDILGELRTAGGRKLGRVQR